MSGIWMDLHGPITADTVRKEGVLVARDVSITLPTITPKTHDFNAMGTMTRPVPGLIDNMEATITKVGLDLGLLRMLDQRSASYEVSWMQVVTDANDQMREENCKAFLRAVPTVIFPGGTIATGSAYEGQIPLSVSRFQVFVEGEEYLLVDRLACICRINGTDYMEKYTSLL